MDAYSRMSCSKTSSVKVPIQYYQACRMLLDDVCVDGRLWDVHLLRVYITETARPQILSRQER